MSNEQQHINPWADKLQQAPLPDADASWKGMEQLLDQRLPAQEKERKRRFLFILFLVMLLVIGSGLIILLQQELTSKKKQDSISYRKINSLQKKEFDSTTNVVSSKRSVSDTHGTNSVKQLNNKRSLMHGNTAKTSSVILNETKKIDAKQEGLIDKNKGLDVMPLTKKEPNADTKASLNNQDKNRQVLNKYNSPTSQGKHLNKANNSRIAASRNRQSDKEALITTNSNATKSENIQTELSSVGNSDTTVSGHIGSGKGAVAFISLITPIKENLYPTRKEVRMESFRESTIPDSLWRQPNTKEDTVWKGWTFDIGINHFFLLPASSSSKNDIDYRHAEGISSSIADYVPVPQVRYYFNNKVFAQVELQINAPQYSQRVLLEQNIKQQGGLILKDEVYIQKLSYFNLPVSMHYSPLQNLSIGAGIQLSRLNNAVALIEQSVGQAQAQDTIKARKVQNIKNDTTYKRLHTSEFRLLGDVSYQVMRFTVGMRYNHALREFVKIPVTATGAVTQARNHSLQVYLRYTFLDKRKKVKPR